MTTDAEVRAWLDVNWDESIPLRVWWQRLAESGYGFPHWSSRLGGLGLQGTAVREVTAALAERAVIAAPAGIGPSMAVPTLAAHGTPQQAADVARSVAAGVTQFCQLFSEPGAGSDLAGVTCRAERDGDEYVVTGQKVWSSGADVADQGLLLARTDVDAPKHRGITYFVVDLQQAGVEVRPLVQMSGRAEFCEVFLDEVRVPASAVVGAVGGGWDVARTTLAAERSMAAMGRSSAMAVVTPGERAGHLDTSCGELRDAWRARERRAGNRATVLQRAETIIALARETGRAAEPVVRQALADYHIRSEVYRLSNRRVADNAKAGRPGPEGSIGKLGLAMLAHRSRDLSLGLLGAAATLSGRDSHSGGAIQTTALSAHAPSIGGGTNEIQRTLIAERFLGLPREVTGIDPDTPFRDLPAN